MYYETIIENDCTLYLIKARNGLNSAIILPFSFVKITGKSSYGRYHGRSVKIDRDRPTSTDREH